VELEEHVSSEVAQAVAENVADVGVVSDLSDFDGVALHPCWRDQLALLAPAGHPLAHAVRVRFAQALEHPMVGLKPGSTLHSRLLRAAAELGRSLPMQVQVGSFDAMCAMIAAGMGVGIMPRAASLPYLDALRLTATPLDESWAEHQLYLCRKADGELSPAAARLFAHLAAQAA
jgi:DNA-binding transcriptional LysR family regulator